MTTVYGLSSSRDGALRYVGQTKADIWKRWAQHRGARDFKAGRLYDWWRAEEAAGFEIKLRIIKRDAVWDVDEIAEIAKARDAGADLLNQQSGGSGDIEARSRKFAKTMRQGSRQRFYNRLYCGSGRFRSDYVGKVMLNYMMGQSPR